MTTHVAEAPIISKSLYISAFSGTASLQPSLNCPGDPELIRCLNYGHWFTGRLLILGHVVCAVRQYYTLGLLSVVVGFLWATTAIIIYLLSATLGGYCLSENVSEQ